MKTNTPSSSLSCYLTQDSNKEIATALGIAEDTVKRHIGNVLLKRGVSDRAQATSEAIRRGIVRGIVRVEG